jgi:hypothetical protein
MRSHHNSPSRRSGSSPRGKSRFGTKSRYPLIALLVSRHVRLDGSCDFRLDVTRDLEDLSDVLVYDADKHARGLSDYRPVNWGLVRHGFNEQMKSYQSSHRLAEVNYDAESIDVRT